MAMGNIVADYDISRLVGQILDRNPDRDLRGSGPARPGRPQRRAAAPAAGDGRHYGERAT